MTHLKITADTPYSSMRAEGESEWDASNEFDWFGAEAEAIIEEQATKYGIPTQWISSELEAYIPDAPTPRKSIERAALAAAGRDS